MYPAFTTYRRTAQNSLQQAREARVPLQPFLFISSEIWMKTWHAAQSLHFGAVLCCCCAAALPLLLLLLLLPLLQCSSSCSCNRKDTESSHTQKLKSRCLHSSSDFNMNHTQKHEIGTGPSFAALQATKCCMFLIHTVCMRKNISNHHEIKRASN